MKVLREINLDNLYDILKLEVKEHQKVLVDSNAHSICHAYFSKEAWLRAIYSDDNVPVGFIMLSIDAEKCEYGLWRLMIDKNHQGKGYAKRAMQEAVEYLKQLPEAKEVVTSYVPKEGNPSGFYKSVGFIDTGEFDESGREVVMKYYF